MSIQKAAEIYGKAKTLFPLVPKADVTKLMVKEAVIQLNTVSRAVEVFRAQMSTWLCASRRLSCASRSLTSEAAMRRRGSTTLSGL